MSSAAILPRADLVVDAGQTTEKYLRFWMRLCDDFRAWERQEIYLVEPAGATLTKYRQSLKWMLRLAHMLESLVKDPDFPDHDLAREVGGRVLQLEESWNAVNNPMSDLEADILVVRHFSQ